MSRICILICQRDEEHPDQLTQLAAFDLPASDRAALQPETTLDELEASTQQVGHAVLRQALVAQWEALDALAVARYCAGFPAAAICLDGHASVSVASRFGTLSLRRQQVFHTDTGAHVLPGNVLLPPHEGRITTRGLQEWSCLLPQDLSFEPVARLLGWQTQDPQVLSSTTVRRLVRAHGGLIRHAEAAEMAVLGQRSDRATLRVSLVPHRRTRPRAGWPLELSAAVDAALAREHPRPPEGVSWADWERVLAIRRLEVDRSNEDLPHLGPQLVPGQVLLTLDEVLVRTQERHRFQELHTARLVTAAGARYLSGVGEPFLQQIVILLTCCLGPGRSLLLIADGARWIRAFFQERLAALPGATMLLDGYHLQQKCRQACSRICQSRIAQEPFLRRLYRRLWAGDVPAALRLLETYRPQARDGAAIETLIGYLAARQPWIPNYRQRRRERQYIGSGHVEKANDLLVARRQKGHGRHWGAQTSEGLLALRTLQLNGGWERYWRHRQVLPLAS